MATRIKRYEARVDQYDDLLARIENEMGPAAQLSKPSWFRRGGFLGLIGGQQMVEVVATLDVAEPLVEPATTAPAPDGPATAATKPLTQSEPAAGYQDSGTLAPPAIPRRKVDITADAPAGIESRPGNAAQGEAASATQAGTAPPIVRKAEFPRARPGLPAGAVERIAADARQFASRQTAEPPKPIPSLPAEQNVVQPAMPLETPAPATVQQDSPAVPDSTGAETDISELRDSISELRETITQLADQQRAALSQLQPAPAVTEPVGTSRAGLGQPDAGVTEKTSATTDAEPAEAKLAPVSGAGVVNPVLLDRGAELLDTQRRVYDRLLDWNIGTYDALALINTAQAEHAATGDPSEDEMLKLIFREICRNILLSEGIHLRSAPPGKVVALVGATGVGKTTTIAKLAAHFAFHHNARVSFVSLDNYRIAAAEQLRTYADIMGLDINIVFSRDEFDQVLTERRSCDLTLIDTAGRSPTNTKQIYELREIFSAHPPDEVHLVVSASTKADDLRMLLENFEPLSYDHVIVSKLDETRSLGCLYNLSKFCQLPISYLTVGQSVPEDIRTANLAFVRTWIEQGRIT